MAASVPVWLRQRVAERAAYRRECGGTGNGEDSAFPQENEDGCD